MLPKSVVEILKTQKVVFITDPQKVEYSFRNGKLKVWKEEIPYKDLLGVVFVQKPNKTPKVRKISLILPPLELKNIKTHSYSEDEKLIRLKEVCDYVGKYLQVYLKRYLGKRDPLGVSKTKRTFWGYVQRYRENHVFLEFFTDCTKDGKVSDIELKLGRYVGDALNPQRGVYGILTLYLGVLIAHKMGLKIPSEPKLVVYLFLPSIYAMVHMLEIKEGVFELSDYSKIPLRGQVYTFLNEFLNNDAFQEHFLFSLKLLS